MSYIRNTRDSGCKSCGRCDCAKCKNDGGCGCSTTDGRKRRSRSKRHRSSKRRSRSSRRRRH